jgi:hypothetical protein
LVTALLLLSAQTSATTHFHQHDLRVHLTHSMQGDDALCSLCLFHFNAPANPVGPPPLVGPLTVVGQMVLVERARLHALAIALSFSRAPPLSL